MPSKHEKHFDVCVIGAGPAGSAAANRLATLGYDTLLVDALSFPRNKIGESLTPAIWPLLQTLNVASAVQNAGFPQTRGLQLLWGEETKDQEAQNSAPGINVDRADFDRLLLSEAVAAGVDARQSCRVRSVTRCQKLTGWLLQSTQGDIRCNYLVDAAGRRGVLRGRWQRTSPSTLALYAYWQLPSELGGGPTRVEAGPDCWYWAAELPGEIANVVVFLDSKSALRAHGGLEGDYLARLARSRLLAPFLDGKAVSPVKVCDASSGLSLEPVGHGFVKVGEAALAVDPLSSQGVTLAISTGLKGAAVINTMAQRPEIAARAHQFYQDQVTFWSAHYQMVSQQFYGKLASADAHPFWKKRADAQAAPEARTVVTIENLTPDLPLCLSEHTTICQQDILQDDLISEALCLRHNADDMPIAFLAGIPIGQLLPALEQTKRADEIVGEWSKLMPPSDAIHAVKHLYALGVLQRSCSKYNDQ